MIADAKLTEIEAWPGAISLYCSVKRAASGQKGVWSSTRFPLLEEFGNALEVKAAPSISSYFFSIELRSSEEHEGVFVCFCAPGTLAFLEPTVSPYSSQRSWLDMNASSYNVPYVFLFHILSRPITCYK